MQARHELKKSLRLETGKQSIWDWLLENFHSIFFQQKLVFGGALTLAIGFALGYFSFLPATKQAQEAFPPTSSTSLSSTAFAPGQNNGKIANVRFSDVDANDGNVEFSFDAVTPVTLKGNVNDERIQKILTYALLNEQNPGTRLRSADALANDYVKSQDSDTKQALITALVSDDNTGVRREALRALRKYPFDDQIKDAFLHVLTSDDNSSLRIEAINGLDAGKSQKNLFGKEVQDVLRGKMQHDNNNYIRLRAKAVLQEVSR